MDHPTPGLPPAAEAVGTAAPATDSLESRLEANKRTVLEFYHKALNGSDVEAAASYFGPHYIQHNPAIADGIDGFFKFVRQLRQNFPQVRGDIKRVFADGDFVILHVHARRTPEELGLAIIDIFRLEKGKIVEHWDVRQPMPESAAHGNGMF
jgi:predicted SnoaL-like aldol condensation-catalyzing enzyme